MGDPEDLEERFSEYWDNLLTYVPDGIIEVDLQLLQDLELLHAEEVPSEDDALSQNFYIVESLDKLTLFNDHFAIWIVPKMVEEIPTTYTLIARYQTDHPRLALAFSTAGVYNHSGLVLRILERFLKQIDENEAAIMPYE